VIVLKKRVYRLNVPVSPQPVCLRFEVPVNNITLLILKTPWRNNDGIALPDPGTFLYLPLDPAHTGNPVYTLNTDVICPQHRLGKGKLFVVPFLGQSYTDDGSTIRVHRIWICCSIVFLM
jgi:hypothetical protein